VEPWVQDVGHVGHLQEVLVAEVGEGNREVPEVQQEGSQVGHLEVLVQDLDTDLQVQDILLVEVDLGVETGPWILEAGHWVFLACLRPCSSEMELTWSWSSCCWEVGPGLVFRYHDDLRSFVLIWTHPPRLQHQPQGLRHSCHQNHFRGQTCGDQTPFSVSWQQSRH